jgi:glycosyltransferase involved in cell wall biosynthesis
MRIGYLVPEFPGQTHIFFWRERQSLARMGIECHLVSTRRPPQKLIAHSWSAEAMSNTRYLSPIGLRGFLSGIAAIIRSGPSGASRVVSAILNADVSGLPRRLRLVGLALAGGHLASIARSNRWTHLHAHSCADSAHVALFAHLIGGVPYSMTLHGPLGDYGPNQAMKWHHAAFGIVITKRLLGELYTTITELQPGKVDIAPMGVDVNRFQRSRAYSPWKGHGPFKIFSCGRLNPCKGHDDLIRAVARLRAAGIEATLSIAGADDSGGWYQAELTALIDQLNLQQTVDLLGAVAEEVVIKHLEVSHAFSLASLNEPLGVAIMEAMSMELPVVVTQGGGVKELVTHHRDGILVEARNPEDLASGLQFVARNPDAALALAASARQRIVDSFQSTQSARTLARRLGVRTPNSALDQPIPARDAH